MNLSAQDILGSLKCTEDVGDDSDEESDSDSEDETNKVWFEMLLPFKCKKKLKFLFYR